MKKYISLLTIALTSQMLCAQNFTDSNLPIVVLQTGGMPIDSAYTPEFVIWMGVIDNPTGRNHLSDPFTYSGKIKIKDHGNSTQWFPKKAWNVTTINATNANLDTTLLGLPHEHDWVFKALYEDKTLIRDQLSFRVFNYMGHYCSRTRYFELVVDNNYRGVYQLQEKIKHGKNRVDVSKLKATDLAGDQLTGGYLVSIDRVKTGDQFWNSNYYSNQANDSATQYLYQYPKPDSMPQVQKNYIHHLFDRYETAVSAPNWTAPDSGYGRFIDIQSFVDKFLIEEVSRNTDGYRLKAWFYKNRDSKGDGKIHAGPIWDYAIGWGNCSFSGGNNPAGWQYAQPYYTNFIPFWWRKIMTDINFQNAVQCRYRELRTSVLSESYLDGYIDSLTNYLSESQQRNFQRWPILGQNTWPEPQPVPADYNGEIAQLKSWIHQRLAWLDQNIAGSCTMGISQKNPDIEFTVYPNPFVESLDLKYTVSPQPDNPQVVIELYNALGSRTFLSFATRKPGSYHETIAANTLAPGIYTLKLSIGANTYNTKIIKVN